MSWLGSFLWGGGEAEGKAADMAALTWAELLGESKSKSGVPVSEATAIRVSAVWGCCRVLCEDVGKLPLKLIREVDDSKQIAREHRLHRILSRRPNPWQTSMEWRMQMLLHALLAQGGYSFINRSASGEVLELVPLLPGNVRPWQDSALRRWYDVSDRQGKIATLAQSQIHALHGLSWDGLSGLRVVDQGAEAIGLAMATEEAQARLHGQGARPGGVLSTDQKLGPDQIERLRSQFSNAYGGIANAFKTLVLDAGLKFERSSMTSVEAQGLETRKHQVEEICRFFRVFPSMIGYSDKASTYASAEAFFSAHVVHSLQPWVELWEQAMMRDLLTDEELDAGLRPKFFLQGLLRGDTATRFAGYESAITKACWMTRNEARRLEDLDPLPGLDEPLTPLNMATPSAPTDTNPA